MRAPTNSKSHWPTQCASPLRMPPSRDSQSDFVFVRKMTIELVLATDMRQHFALNGAFASMHRLATSQGVDRVLKQFTPHSSPGASMAKPPPGPAAPAQQQQQQQRRAPRTSKTSANLRLPFAAVFGAGGSGSGFGRASARPELSEVDPETVLPSGAGGTAPQQSVRNSLDLPRGSPVSAGSHAHQSCGGSAAAHAALTVARASVEPRPPEVHVALAQPAAGGQPGGYRRAGSSGLGDLERCSSRSPGGGTVGGGGHPAPCPGPQDDTDRLLALQVGDAAAHFLGARGGRLGIRGRVSGRGERLTEVCGPPRPALLRPRRSC